MNRVRKKSSVAARARAGDRAAGARPAALLDDVEALDGSGADARLDRRFRRTPAWRRLSRQPPDVRAAVIVEAVTRLGALRRQIADDPKTVLRGNLHREPGYSFARMTALAHLLRKPPPLAPGAWSELLGELARFEVNGVPTMRILPSLATAFRRHAAKHGIADGRMSDAVRRIIRALSDPPTSGYRERAVIAKLEASLASTAAVPAAVTRGPSPAKGRRHNPPMRRTGRGR